MFRVALKSVLGNKLRFGLTALAVVLGVAFVAGVFVLTDSIQRSFDGLIGDINAGTAVYVNPKTDIEAEIAGGTGAVGGPTIDEAVLDEIAAVDGVRSAEGGVGGLAVILDPEGNKVGAASGPPALGFSWAETIGPLTIAEGDGRPPVAEGEVVIDRGSFTALQDADPAFGLGSSVTIVLQNGGPQEFEVVGVSTFGDSDNLLGATTASFSLAEAQRVFDKQGELDQIGVVADGTVPDDELAAAISAVVGDDLEVITGAEQTENDLADIQQGLGFLTTALLAFAGIALFVGAFIIVNTFSIIIAQRTREFALLRAIGASGRQIQGAVMIEALVVGLVASIIGLGAGVALAAVLQSVMDAAGISIPQSGIIVEPRTVIASFAVGVGVTVLSAILPSRRAAKISPIEGLRDAAGVASAGISVRRTAGGAVAAVAGVVSLALGLAGLGENAVALVGVGVGLTFIGVSLLAPHSAGPVAKVLGAIPARSGVPGRLAQRNSARNATRTASTASALMIGVALVTFVSIFSSSAIKSVDVLFEEQFGADFSISADSGFGPPAGLPTALAEELRALPEVGAVATFRASNIRIGDQTGTTFVASTDPDTAEQLISFGFIEGGIERLAEPGTVLIDDEVAERDGVGLGDTIIADFAARDRVELEIVGIFTNEEIVGAPWVVSNDALDEYAGNLQDLFIGADVAEGVASEDARAAIEGVTSQYSQVLVQTQAELREQTQEQVNGLLNGLIVLLALAVVIAVIGIVNTLALSVFERTREIGLLRAVGMSRRQTRAMIRWEAVIVSIFGALLGLVVGVFFGWAMVQALRSQGITQLAIPGGRMVVYVVVAGFAGVLAAILPARRAARLDVLAAVTSE